MKSTDAPVKQIVPFGANGPREAITATTPSGSNKASYDQGFPPITMTLKSAGGLPPKGQDMNQILYEQSLFARYYGAGGSYAYDASFATGIGGYPLGARLLNSTKSGFWINSVEDNSVNPENTTAALTGWVPGESPGITTVSGLASSSVTLTSLQASKSRIILNGSLTANINVVVPAWVRKWDIVNNCTGSFAVTIKTPSGSGATIPSGATLSVYGDGVNINPDLNSWVMIGAPQIITASGTYTPTPGTKRIIVEMVGGGAGGREAKPPSSASGTFSGGGGSGAYAKFRLDAVPSSVSVSVGIGGSSGLPGGESKFGSYCTTGGGQTGENDASTSATTVTCAGGPGASYPVINLPAISILASAGQPGFGGVAAKSNNGFGGHGGSTPLAQGGQGNQNGRGFNAGGYGAGGGGCFIPSGTTTTTNSPGGTGGGGVIIVYEYA